MKQLATKLLLSALCVTAMQSCTPSKPDEIALYVELNSSDTPLVPIVERLQTIGYRLGGRAKIGPPTSPGWTQNLYSDDLFLGLTYIGVSHSVDFGVIKRTSGDSTDLKVKEVFEIFCAAVAGNVKQGGEAKFRGDAKYLSAGCSTILQATR
ncbi:MAG: hypothetical protein QM741_00010 [Rudaea sp.]|uniref:hypothetical protein n=1 Tax=Rudaea sp. TaxID=2136325 RepID=UPI0039E6C864